jgi:hypothetical protein
VQLTPLATPIVLKETDRMVPFAERLRELIGRPSGAA